MGNMWVAQMLDDIAVVSAVQAQEWEREKEQESKAALQLVDEGVQVAVGHSVRGLPHFILKCSVAWCLQVFDEVSGASAAFAAERWEDDKRKAREAAEAVVDEAIQDAAHHQVERRL
jgi:hypothetical protein